ncbi:hypothetical protein SAMN05661093_01206 [Kibdelosporangium aridum]|uniref:Uncharacterized protein n=1 Tax=Kibdelosporangium aridum TaxID=2030 RepID=A0A1W2AZ01_KIBAR|nr:hypothetical protein SAMN05661093_01206 [Kibdelosporangium aridum]
MSASRLIHADTVVTNEHLASTPLNRTPQRHTGHGSRCHGHANPRRPRSGTKHRYPQASVIARNRRSEQRPAERYRRCTTTSTVSRVIPASSRRTAPVVMPDDRHGPQLCTPAIDRTSSHCAGHHHDYGSLDSRSSSALAMPQPRPPPGSARLGGSARRAYGRPFDPRLLLGTRHLALSGASPNVLQPARRLLIFATVATLALNVADPLMAGEYGKAAFDAAGPLLLIGRAEIGPGFLQAISASTASTADHYVGSESHRTRAVIPTVTQPPCREAFDPQGRNVSPQHFWHKHDAKTQHIARFTTSRFPPTHCESNSA